MKYLKLIIFFFTLTSLLSCGSDDDICESGEGTPRMKIMFKTEGKTTTLDSIKVIADLGNAIVDFGWNRNVDSLFVPLRVDDSPYTDLYFRTSTQEDSSRVRVNYSSKAIYVSPGCGAKKNYENVNSVLSNPNSILSVEQGQNFIQNEEKTNLFLNL